jgi:hypothetical protein
MDRTRTVVDGSALIHTLADDDQMWSSGRWIKGNSILTVALP